MERQHYPRMLISDTQKHMRRGMENASRVKTFNVTISDVQGVYGSASAGRKVLLEIYKHDVGIATRLNIGGMGRRKGSTNGVLLKQLV